MAQHFSDVSVELQIVITCCEWPRSIEQSGKLSSLLRRPFNEDRLQQLLRRHELQAMAWPALKPFASILSLELRSALESKANKVLRQNLQLLAESQTLAFRMRESGLSMVFLKGIPLATQVYGQISFRQSKDLDILVGPEDIVQAEQVLLSEHYEPMGRMICTVPSKQRGRWLRAYKHTLYRHPRRGTVIELHTRLSENFYLLREMTFQSQAVPIPGSELQLPGLTRADLLIYLCVHGAVHNWARFKWLADVNALLSRMTETEQTDIVERAETLGAERPVLLAMVLCNRLFGTFTAAPSKVPAPVDWAARFVMFSMTRADGLKHPETLLSGKLLMTLTCLLLSSDRNYQVQELTRRIFKAGDKDGNLFPRWLAPLPLPRFFLWPLSTKKFSKLHSYLTKRVNIS